MNKIVPQNGLIYESSIPFFNLVFQQRLYFFISHLYSPELNITPEMSDYKAFSTSGSFTILLIALFLGDKI